GEGDITAPRIGTMIVRGDSARGIAAELAANLTLTGAGNPGGEALGKLLVHGTVRNMTARIQGDVGSAIVRQLVNSQFFVGFTPTDPAQPLLGGVFTSQSRVGSLLVTGLPRNGNPAWEASTVVAAHVGSSTIASVATNNGGIPFGILGEQTVGLVRVNQPPFIFNPGAQTPQGIGDFQIRRGNGVVPPRPVTVEAGLANDTARDGLTNTDGITRDPALVGTVTNVANLRQLRLRFSDRPDQFFDVTADVEANGRFHLNRARLEVLRGGPLPDGAYTASFQAVDQGGNVSALVPVSFVLDTTPPGPPANLRLTATSDTGFSSADGITSVATPTLTAQAEAQALVRLFRAGQLVGEATANNTVQITVTGALADGQHEFTATATDVAGNESTAATVQITVDTQGPTLELESPVNGGEYSGTLRVSGDSDDSGSGMHQVRILLNGNESAVATPDGSGQFDVRASRQAIAPGSYQIVVQAIDRAGNVRQVQRTVTVSNAFFIGAAGTDGWGSRVHDVVRLEERDSLVVQTSQLVTVGPGSRRLLHFDVQAQFDTSDATLLEDQLLIYLVDPSNPGRTLLDRGEPGTALLSIGPNGRVETAAGLVTVTDGHVTIDVTGLPPGQGRLLMQLLGGDRDTGSVVEIRNLRTEVDEEAEATAPPTFPPGPTSRSATGVDLTGLEPAPAVQPRLSNVRLDPATGQLRADLTVASPTGTPGRQVAVVFSGLPAGVQLETVSGFTPGGDPFVHLRNAIPAGGLAPQQPSRVVTLLFDNDNLLRLPLTAQVLVGPANRPPTFAPLGPLTVTPGDVLRVPLQAIDPDGDLVAFSLRPHGPLPTLALEGNHQLVVRPTHVELGTYQFDVIATDGSVDVVQTLTLTVAPDPLGRTRLSGVVLDTSGRPVANLPVSLGQVQGLTAADGTFTLTLSNLAMPTDEFDIPVPAGDPFFDPFNTGRQIIDFNRARFDPLTGTSTANPRRHPNLVTSFIDASPVYGSTQPRADALRAGNGTGRLKSSPGELPPLNNTTYFPNGPLDNINAGIGDPSQLFVTGDIRANENIGLAALHAVFAREHNRLADEIRQANPTLTDEEIYQRARRLLGAMLQHITYHEYLPLVLGPNALAPYTGYKPNVQPDAGIFFATAAFRFPHTQTFPNFPLLDAQGNPLPGTPLSLRRASFTTAPIRQHGLDPILRGLAATPAHTAGLKVIDEVRNLLFGPPGSGGIDLIATDIQRGRDLGLPSYNRARQDYGLPPVTSFAQISSDPAVQAALQTAYGTVDKIDAFIGGLAEDRVPGAMVGPLFFRVLKDQFERIRDGDRFWYENGQFTAEELALIRNTKLSDIIRRNTGITNLPDHVLTLGTPPTGPAPAGTAAPAFPGEFRTIDGSGNNLANPNWGRTNNHLRLDMTLSYGDGISTPAGNDRPGAREISNAVSATTGFTPEPAGLSALGLIFSQFLTHDLSLTPPGTPDTLKIHGTHLNGPPHFPFIAEKVDLLLERPFLPGVNNRIERPIFLPPIDVANGATIDPTRTMVVTTPAIPGASVTVAAGTLLDRGGRPFDQVLSITEVPPE
ncbi:MAG: peroxidase family protein, partial [Gemmataceae bacterium]|nr:peroxidase family protein [Gemmataceae bacterium]